MFSNSNIGFLLFITHTLSAITVGILLGLLARLKHKLKNNIFEHSYNSSTNELCTFNNLGSILSNAILESSKTIIMIGGFVVIFSVIISILGNSKILEIFSYLLYIPLKLLNIDLSFAKPIISGIIELTNGVLLVSSVTSKALSSNIIICAFLLGIRRNISTTSGFKHNIKIRFIYKKIHLRKTFTRNYFSNLHIYFNKPNTNVFLKLVITLLLIMAITLHYYLVTKKYLITTFVW